VLAVHAYQAVAPIHHPTFLPVRAFCFGEGPTVDVDCRRLASPRPDQVSGTEEESCRETGHATLDLKMMSVTLSALAWCHVNCCWDLLRVRTNRLAARGDLLRAKEAGRRKAAGKQ
jgi:hypothetical protein